MDTNDKKIFRVGVQNMYRRMEFFYFKDMSSLQDYC